MTIKVGDRLPAGVLWEFIEEETPGCTVGPNSFKVEELVRGKRIAVFGLPGAFTPTCSAKHLPGFVSHADKLKSAKVDEIWCLSVNDAFVMGAWGREQGAKGKIRMMADGSGLYSKALGLEMDLMARGLGRTLPALFHAGPGWRGEDAQYRRAGKVRGQQCREDARAGPEGDELYSVRNPIRASRTASGCSAIRS